MKTWNDIRSAWVNGECAEVIEHLKSLSRKELITFFHAAIIIGQNGINLTGRTMTGDLNDLREITSALQLATKE